MLTLLKGQRLAVLARTSRSIAHLERLGLVVVALWRVVLGHHVRGRVGTLVARRGNRLRTRTRWTVLLLAIVVLGRQEVPHEQVLAVIEIRLVVVALEQYGVTLVDVGSWTGDAGLQRHELAGSRAAAADQGGTTVAVEADVVSVGAALLLATIVGAGTTGSKDSVEHVFNGLVGVAARWALEAASAKTRGLCRGNDFVGEQECEERFSELHFVVVVFVFVGFVRPWV